MDAGSATRANRNASSATWNRCATPKIKRSELQRSALRIVDEFCSKSIQRGFLSVLRGLKPVWNHWQIIETNASRVKDGVADCRRHGHDGCLAGSGRADVLAIQQDRFDPRHVTESRHAIGREMRI